MFGIFFTIEEFYGFLIQILEFDDKEQLMRWEWRHFIENFCTKARKKAGGQPAAFQSSVSSPVVRNADESRTSFSSVHSLVSLSSSKIKVLFSLWPLWWLLHRRHRFVLWMQFPHSNGELYGIMLTNYRNYEIIRESYSSNWTSSGTGFI